VPKAAAKAAPKPDAKTAAVRRAMHAGGAKGRTTTATRRMATHPHARWHAYCAPKLARFVSWRTEGRRERADRSQLSAQTACGQQTSPARADSVLELRDGLVSAAGPQVQSMQKRATGSIGESKAASIAGTTDKVHVTGAGATKTPTPADHGTTVWDRRRR